MELKKIYDSRWYTFTPMMPNAIRIATVLVIYYYLFLHHLFPLWLDKMFLWVKIYIAVEMLLGAVRSLMMPMLMSSLGLLFLFVIPLYQITILSIIDAWQLIIAASLSFLIAFFI